jgi:hypothetical protein
MFLNRLYELNNQQDGNTKANSLINHGNNKTKAQGKELLYFLFIFLFLYEASCICRYKSEPLLPPNAHNKKITYSHF